MADDTLDLKGAGRPIGGARRINNVSLADRRAFEKAFMDERTETWKDSRGVVYKMNRRGTIAQSFAASSEIVSQPKPSAKARVTRLAKRDKNLAIKANSTKRAHGLTKGQRALRGQGQLFATSDVAETDTQLQNRIMKDINKAKTQSLKEFLISQGMGLSIAPAISGGLDNIFGSKMAENSGRGSGGGRMMSRPRKAL